MSDKNTGAYAGPTVVCTWRAGNDVNKFRQEDTFDDYFRIQLKRRS